MIFIEVPVGEPARVVNLHSRALRTILGLVSFAYPFPDPDIGLAHDDEGIANGRLPNRIINGVFQQDTMVLVFLYLRGGY